MKLHHETERKRSVSSKLSHEVHGFPAHRMRLSSEQEEEENPGVESADAMGKLAEDGISAHRRIHRAHQRKLQRREIYAQSHTQSRRQQHRNQQRRYRPEKGKTLLSGTGTQRSKSFHVRSRRGWIVFAILAVLILILFGAMSSCSMLAQSVLSAIGTSSYPSEDCDMLEAEEQYCSMEEELQEYLDTYESTHSYDEYVFELDEIGHDPYVLISILTALHNGRDWTIDEVQLDLSMLFELQYVLTESVSVEIRYRTEYEPDSEGNLIPVPVPYEYYICTVILETNDLTRIPSDIFTQDQLSLYAMYMVALGNRADLFPDSDYVDRYITGEYEDYEIPAEALEDEMFAAIVTEAEKYLGFPYVWGGSSPSTSFDCSGFVSYVYNQCGWNFGRQVAQGLYNLCTPVSNPKPGDLVFFVGTYDTPGISHVGIYVGENRMLHCGDVRPDRAKVEVDERRIDEGTTPQG